MSRNKTIGQIVNFYKNCYEAELKNGKEIHLKSTQIERYDFVQEEEELLTEDYPFVPISQDIGSRILYTQSLRGSELELKYYAGFNLRNELNFNDKESRKIYPLMAFDAEVFLNKSHYYLKVDLDSRVFLEGSFPSEFRKSNAFAKLRTIYESGFGLFGRLSNELNKSLNNSSADSLLDFPKLISKKQINKTLKAPFFIGETFVSGAALAIVKKEKNTFSVQEELEKVVGENHYSTVIRTLFGFHENKKQSKAGLKLSILNSGQEQALKSSNEHVVSTIEGPPGTGKSYTIANIAAEKMSKGESVLIASKNKEALAVIEEKIQSQLNLPEICINTAADKRFGKIREHLKFVLGRSYVKSNIPSSEVDGLYQSVDQEIEKLFQSKEILFNKFEKERNYFDFIEEKLDKSSVVFKNRVIKHRVEGEWPIWSLLHNYYLQADKLIEKKVAALKLARQLILQQGLDNDRSTLRNYESFLKARDPLRKLKLLEDLDFEVILRFYPIWLTTTNDVSKLLPYKEDLFDVLIIDEGSQCDIPSILPLLQRAKSCIIVGDPKQLTHISFLSKANETQFKQEVEVDQQYLCRHRDYSILDFALDNIDPKANAYLNEHFRSQYPIISFSNRQFYNNELDVLSKRPLSKDQSVFFRKKRGIDSRGKNLTEIKAIISRVKAIVKEEEELDDEMKNSIGILSPYRNQVNAIIADVQKEFSIEIIKAHKIIVGTAHTFQGSEKDYMLISLKVNNDSPGGSFAFLNRADVFNVSMTRAKYYQEVYYSFDENKLNPTSLLSHFFNHYKHLENEIDTEPSEDNFYEEVAQFLTSEECTIWPNFRISGIQLDILVHHKSRYIGIDLVGHPGDMQDYYSIERYQTLKRGNIEVYPIPYILWLKNNSECKSFIFKQLNQYLFV